jgi:hypothetical protein
MEKKSISKLLSANDTGDTGGHQAGILVPKEETLLSFFPELDADEYNPRVHLIFIDDSAEKWEFAFIYYNNRLHQRGTRNEYRLTRMTKFIRQAGLVPGDEVILTRETDASYRVSFRRKRVTAPVATNTIRLGSGWRVIDI